MTTEEYTCSHPETKSTIIIAAGTFVKPIETVYLPDHIKEEASYRWFQKSTEQFVYCSYGILVIPKHIIREA